jgi:hypothetical protein
MSARLFEIVIRSACILPACLHAAEDAGTPGALAGGDSHFRATLAKGGRFSEGNATLGTTVPVPSVFRALALAMLSLSVAPMRAEESPVPSLDSPRTGLSAYSVDAMDNLYSADRSLFDTAALGRIAAKLKAPPFHTLFHKRPVLSPTYRAYSGLEKYCIFELRLDSVPDGASGRMQYRIGIEGWGGAADRVHGPTRTFLRSAYLEEILPDYLARAPGAFITLEPKSTREFWTRNLYSMGYALQYAGRDNPFSPELGSSRNWGYVFDAVTYLILFSGLAAGDGETLLGGAIAWGAGRFWSGMKEAHIDYYNGIVASGYRIPGHARYDSLLVRERVGEDAPRWSGAFTRVGAARTPDVAPGPAALDGPGAEGDEAYAAFAGRRALRKASVGDVIAIAMAGPVVGAVAGTGMYVLTEDRRASGRMALAGLVVGGLTGLGIGLQFAFDP